MAKESGWIEVNLPWWKYNQEGKSFSGSEGLNKPGTLVRVEGEVFLIGHINTIAGVCDDCCEFSNEAIIVAYKVVWEEEK